MRIQRIELINYRNYAKEMILLSPGVNVFLGQNAQGKTNILEAVYYAALGRSHRTSVDAELVRWEAREAKFSLDFLRFDVENRLEFLFFREKRRKIIKNSASVRMKDLIGTVNAVLFSPEDLSIVRSGPGERRRFLDHQLLEHQATPVLP